MCFSVWRPVRNVFEPVQSGWGGNAEYRGNSSRERNRSRDRQYDGRGRILLLDQKRLVAVDALKFRNYLSHFIRTQIAVIHNPMIDNTKCSSACINVLVMQGKFFF